MFQCSMLFHVSNPPFLIFYFFLWLSLSFPTYKILYKIMEHWNI